MGGAGQPSTPAARPSGRFLLRLPHALPDLLVVGLALLLLGPALLPGYVLSYDLVWVRDLAVTTAGWGLGDGVPRAVPSDQVVALLDEVVPGMLLQKVVLLGALVGAGCGAHRLVRTSPPAVRLAAAAVALWNPFVAERLLLGHWPVLLAYAALPWLLLAGRALRERGGAGLPLVVAPLAAVGALSASAGLTTTVALVLLVGVVGGATRRTWGALGLVAVAANAPWVVAGLAAGAVTRPDAGAARVAAEVFAARGPGDLPAPVAVLGLGGVWNTATVPDSLTGPRAWAWAVLVVAALVGLALRSGPPRRESAAVGAAAAVGLGLALLSWAAPGLLAAVATAVPGGGVLRDGSRLVGLAVPAVVLGLAALVTAATRALRGPPVVAASVVAALLPVLLLPDLAGGAAGRLEAVAIPGAYGEARDALRADAAARDLADRPVLVLPFASYRAPDWNGGRPVLDPVPRLLGGPALVSDELVVADRVVAGEDPRGPVVRAALALDTPEERSAALREAGVAYVVHARGPDVDAAPESLAPDLAGTALLRDERLDVQRLEGADGPADVTAPAPSGAARVGAVTVAWVLYGGLLVAPAGAVVLRRTGAPGRGPEDGSPRS
ncbi:hypothetical protein [Nocardioides alkalitolerans]|uniref:hypothetical protein n=1 Tax=Nocardioides alkalitolerans TaxID=281714 RepID=UPI0012FCA8A4|nr:hypothetical protein [Nocardioides alkalitolerans]